MPLGSPLAAINRDEIVSGANFGLGTPARTMLRPKTPFYWTGSEQAAPTYDVTRAGMLLDPTVRR